MRQAVREPLSTGRDHAAKVSARRLGRCASAVATAPGEAREYFHRRLDQHPDLVERRWLKEETLPAAQKVFSLCEPHTAWMATGKPRPHVGLDQRRWIATDPHERVPDYAGPVGGAGGAQRGPLTGRRWGRYGAGALARIRFDKGFTRAQDRDLL